MRHYLDLCQRVIEEGHWVTNERTGKRCLTVINADMTYDCSDGSFPVVTTKKLAWKSAIAEMLGYLRGYRSAEQFRSIGCKTWDANANENKAWLNNRYRQGIDDMGRVYGVQGRSWINQNFETFDQLKKIVDDLTNGIDDRREILTFWNPGEIHMGCLAACMHTHTFSLLGDTLYLTSYQRSDDLPLGHCFNQVQVAWLLMVMAQITGKKAGKAYHKIVNVHIYEDQLELMKEQINREPYQQPKLKINPNIKSLKDLETWVTINDFELVDYQHHPAITYPFSV